MNIHQATDLDVVRDIKRLAKERETTPPKVEELLLDGVDQVAHQWVERLVELRSNIDALEGQIIATVGDIKDRLTRLSELGAQVTAETKRFVAIADEIDEISG